MKTTRIALITSVLCLALAGSAQAATPFTAGTGFGHDLAVGSDGTGHIVWLQDEEPADRIHYCRVPAGGSACDAESTVLDFPGPGADAFSIGDEAQIFAPAPNKVVIAASCFSCGTEGSDDQTFRYISSNNGVSFGAGVHVGELALQGQSGFLDVDNTVLGVEGGQFQAMDSILPLPSDPLTLGGGFPFVYSAAVVPGPGEDKAVHAVNDLHTVKYAVWNDPDADPPSEFEYNVMGAWSTGKFLPSPEGENSETHLSSGPNGVFLTYEYFTAGNDHVGLRKFDPATDSFGAPVYADGENPIDDNSLDYPHHSQDGAGRLHFVWRNLYDGNRLRYVRSDDGGVTFTSLGTLAANETFLDPIVEAGPAGTGFAVWKGIGQTPIRVVVIDPIPESAPPPDVPGPPTITGFGVGDPTLTPGQGTTFTFNSSEPGNAVLTIERRFKGKKGKKKPGKKRKCRAVSNRKFKKLAKKKRCKGWKRIGQISQPVQVGQNTIAFSGRVAGRKLGKGQYRARLVITDLAGNVSRTETIKFKVIAKKKAKGKRDKPTRRG